MLRDNPAGLIEPMRSSAGANPLALCTAGKPSSDDRPPCLENPRPEGAESTLTENAASPFHAKPRHFPSTLVAITQELARAPRMAFQMPLRGTVIVWKVREVTLGACSRPNHPCESARLTPQPWSLVRTAGLDNLSPSRREAL